MSGQASLMLMMLTYTPRASNVLSDIPLFVETDGSSSLWSDASIVRDNCVEHSAEAPTTGADVFKLALRILNTLTEQL